MNEWKHKAIRLFAPLVTALLIFAMFYIAVDVMITIDSYVESIIHHQKQD